MVIFLFPSPSACPSTCQTMKHYGKLFSLRQGVSTVKEFAHQFVITAEGLDINNTALKDIFNNGLNEPVRAWEMGMLGILSFWQFVGYVYNRGEEGGLPPLGPPPIHLTSCQVPSPPMTPSGRGRRKNSSASSASYPLAAEEAAAPPLAAEEAAAPPLAAEEAAAPPLAAEEAAAPPLAAEEAAAPPLAAEETSTPPVAFLETAAAPPCSRKRRKRRRAPVAHSRPVVPVPVPVVPVSVVPVSGVPVSVVPSPVVPVPVVPVPAPVVPVSVVPSPVVPVPVVPVPVVPVSVVRRRKRKRKASSTTCPVAPGPGTIPEVTAIPDSPSRPPALPAPLKLLALPAPLKLLALPAPLKLLALPAPLKLLALPAPLKLLALPAPLKLLALPAPPKLLALPAPPKLLALPAPPKLLALPAPPKLLALPAPPKLLALPAPPMLPVMPGSAKLPEAVPEPVASPEAVAKQPAPPYMAFLTIVPVFPKPGQPAPPALMALPLQPVLSMPPKVPATPWPSARIPDPPESPWSVPPAPPWPSARIPDPPESPWSVPPAPPWPSARIPDPPESPWSVPPVPPWSSAMTPDLSEPPWLNPPVPPWSLFLTLWMFLLALTWLPSLPTLSLCLDLPVLCCLLFRLKLDHQTGSLNITNTRNTDSGEYKLLIIINISSFSISRVKRLSVSATDVQCNEGTERFRDRLKLDHQTGSLTITNITNTDSGVYYIQFNSSSDREKIFKVTVWVQQAIKFFDVGPVRSLESKGPDLHILPEDKAGAQLTLCEGPDATESC
ncbi:hypothetical protein PO909_028203 [Leuciscus waleckii]